MSKLNREKVRASFHCQAHHYDGHAVVQRKVVQRIVRQLAADGMQPGRILDVGAGTGRLLAALHELFPAACAVGIDLAPGMCQSAAAKLAGTGIDVLAADAEELPFPDGSFDLVLSTSTFQWLDTLELAFGEAFRVLSPGGLFRFALFGGDTLFELRDSYRRARKEGSDRSLDFFAAAEVLHALENAGFCGCGVHAEIETEWHADVPDLLRSLKRIGAKTVPAVNTKGLSERRVMLEMMELYRREYGTDQGIPASYEVVYGVGRK